jgi:NAD(P)H-binding
VARVLIVGCGCRGRELAKALIAAGHSVRGTTRERGRLATIEAAGAEGVEADPDRLATLLPHVEGASAICWLMGSADGDARAALHGPRLRSLLESLVDSPVRGFVYEADGGEGEEAVRLAERTFRIPVEIVETDLGDHSAWLGEAMGAVGRLLNRP